MHILLLAALPEEADTFCPGQGIVLDDEPMPVRDVALPHATVRIVTCGLGKVNAALAVGRYTASQTDLIAITGTCGRMGAIEGDTFWIVRAVQHDYGAQQPGGHVHYRAGDWPMGEARDQAFTAMLDPGLGLPRAAIASGDIFLECPEKAQALAQMLGTQLVDMEVAAVAQAAEALGLPWAAIKAITDGADSESVGDFGVNLRRAARKAAEAMERLCLALVEPL